MRATESIDTKGKRKRPPRDKKGKGKSTRKRATRAVKIKPPKKYFVVLLPNGRAVAESHERLMIPMGAQAGKIKGIRAHHRKSRAETPLLPLEPYGKYKLGFIVPTEDQYVV